MAKKIGVLPQLISNIKRLIPYLGVLFVFAGIIGLVLIQNPLETSQDTRSEADEVENLATVTAKVSQNFVVDQTGQISVMLDTGGYTVNELSLYFLLEHPLLDSPEVSIPVTSGFKADSIEVEAVDGGYLVRVVAVPSNLDWFAPQKDITFLRVDAVAHSTMPLYLSFDARRSYISTPAIEILLGVPPRQAISVTDPNGTTPPQQSACTAAGGTWQTFPNSCVDSCEKAANPDDIMCLQALTEGCNCGKSQCWDGRTCVDNPQTISNQNENQNNATETEVAACNESCQSNADCAVGLRCFNTGSESLCRLATNTSSTTCSAATSNTSNSNSNQADLASCNEYCTSNAQCESGYSCYENFCRNPRNPQDNRCTDLTEEQAAATISSCGESCQSNADCAINLRCFTGECRLATNVSSTSCTPATYQTISTQYETNNTTTAQGNTAPKGSTANKTDSQSESSETEKGAQMVPVTDKEYTPVQDRTADKKVYQDTYDANETIFDLIRSIATNQESRLPFLIILLGILLLVGSGLFFLLKTIQDKKQNRIYQTKNQNGKISVESHEVKPGENPLMPPVNNRSTIPQETKQDLLNRIKEK